MTAETTPPTENEKASDQPIVQDAPRATLVYIKSGSPEEFQQGTQPDLCMSLLRAGWADDARALAQMAADQMNPEKAERLNQHTCEQAPPECGCEQPISGWFLMGVA